MKSKILFFIGLSGAAAGLLSRPLALAAGMVFATLLANPFERQSARAAKLLLQLSVIAVGLE
jgi:hypothetical protein